MSTPILYSEKDVADLLGVHFMTLRKYRRENKISFIKVDKVIRYTQQNIDDFIKNNTVEAK